MINWANWLVHMVCDGRQTPKSIIENIETISLSLPKVGKEKKGCCFGYPYHAEGKTG
jgi:hypothetical protein